MRVLGTHGTSSTADSRMVRPSMGTSGVSPGSETSYLMSPALVANVIGAFLSGTTYESLVHKLGRKGP